MSRVIWKTPVSASALFRTSPSVKESNVCYTVADVIVLRDIATFVTLAIVLYGERKKAGVK